MLAKRALIWTLVHAQTEPRLQLGSALSTNLVHFREL